MSYPAQQQNAIESQGSINVDEMMVEYLYPQFNHFLNYYVNKRTKKYKFNFFFEGFKFDSDRQRRIDTAMKMASVGITSFPKIAAAWGMLPQDLQRQMAESNITGWTDNLVPLLNMYNQSQDQGRPQNQQINNDNTLKSRETGSNIQKGGKV